jgi:hypothetical protein
MEREEEEDLNPVLLIRIQSPNMKKNLGFEKHCLEGTTLASNPTVATDAKRN